MNPPYIQNAFAKYIDRDLLARNPILYAQLRECFASAFVEGCKFGERTGSKLMDKKFRDIAIDRMKMEVVHIHKQTRQMAGALNIDLWGKEATS